MTGFLSIASFVTSLPAEGRHCRLDRPDAGRDQLGVLQISGPDAGKFLQGQLTADVLALPVGSQTWAASCTPQGRMRALFRLLRREQDFLLVMPRTVVQPLLEALKKYAVFFKAQLSDASAAFQIWGLLGTETVPAAWPLAPVAECSRQLVLVGSDIAAPALPGSSGATNEWFLAELLAGEPCVYPETIEKLLPHHVNLPGIGAVSFSKGCYTGQEIVARMEYRGKIKTHLQTGHSHFAGELVPGTAIRSGDREVGELVRSRAVGENQLLLITLNDPAQTESLQLALPEAPILELHH
ncbi:MAG: YgfZ/GcvT domain-containing protein [Permianibacter sp.]